jgi:hypothetical protein
VEAAKCEPDQETRPEAQATRRLGWIIQERQYYGRKRTLVDRVFASADALCRQLKRDYDELVDPDASDTSAAATPTTGSLHCAATWSWLNALSALPSRAQLEGMQPGQSMPTALPKQIRLRLRHVCRDLFG